MRLTKTSNVILAIIALLALSDVLSANWTRHVWPLLAALWILLLFCERLFTIFTKFSLQRQVPKRLALGQSVVLTYSVSNKCQRPLRIRATDCLPVQIAPASQTLSWRLGPFENQIQTVNVTPVGCGNVTLQTLHVSVLGFLKLAWWDTQVNIADAVQIQPDYRESRRIAFNKKLSRSIPAAIEQYASVTFVIDASPASRIVSGEIRRLDHYINHCSALAVHALSLHRPVNIIVYNEKPDIVMLGIRQLAGLAAFFKRLQQNETNTPDVTQYQCVPGYLDQIASPGLLIWYSDLADARQQTEFATIIDRLKRRFQIVFYDRADAQNRLLLTDLHAHRRSAAHRLAVLDQQAHWHKSRQLLQHKGIALIRQ